MLAEGKKKIVLNMVNIKYIDSSGLGTLVAAHVSAKTQGASVRLCNLGKKFHEVMQITKLLTIFDVYDTEAAAVSSFQSVLATSNNCELRQSPSDRPKWRICCPVQKPAIDKKKVRDQLKQERNLLVETYLKNPMQTHLAIEI